MSPPPPDPVIDTWIEQQVAAAPPLSDEACSRLAVLLRPYPAQTDHRAA